MHEKKSKYADMKWSCIPAQNICNRHHLGHETSPRATYRIWFRCMRNSRIRASHACHSIPGGSLSSKTANRIWFRDAVFWVSGQRNAQSTHVSLRGGPTWGLNHATNGSTTSRIGFRWELSLLAHALSWNLNEASLDFCQSEELPPRGNCKIYGYSQMRLQQQRQMQEK